MLKESRQQVAEGRGHFRKLVIKLVFTTTLCVLLSASCPLQTANRHMARYFTSFCHMSQPEKNRKRRAVATAKPAAKRSARRSKMQLEDAVKGPLPAGVTPMLASLHEGPFDDAGWVFELKWDGYRAISTISKGKVDLRSRKNISLAKYYPVAEALQELPFNAVLDGEIVVLDDEGHASFQMLQAWTKEEKGLLCYQVFDMLWYEGYDLTGLTLLQRKAILEQVLPTNNVIRYCDHIAERGREFYDLAVQWGVEGIIGKKADSTYHSGSRSRDWLKIKNVQQMEAVIAGFTQGRNSRKYFGALVLGRHEQGRLKYIGHTGSGMDDKTIKSIYELLQPLVTEECPFPEEPKTNMPATWVKPKLVCEVKFQEVTKDGILRIPIFLGIRQDKTANELKREAAYLEKKGRKKKGV